MERNRSQDFAKSSTEKTIMREPLTVNSSVFCRYLCQRGEGMFAVNKVNFLGKRKSGDRHHLTCSFLMDFPI